jgi:putative transposase
MKTLRSADGQILSILKQAEGDEPVLSLCREHGMSSATFYKWCVMYGGGMAAISR